MAAMRNDERLPWSAILVERRFSGCRFSGRRFSGRFELEIFGSDSADGFEAPLDFLRFDLDRRLFGLERDRHFT